MTLIERIYTISSIMAVLCLVVIIAKFITKRLNKKASDFFKKADKILMKIHKPAAILLIASGALHGILVFSNFSQFGIQPYILGIISLLSCIASIACFYMKKRLKQTKHWIVHHRFFAAIALISFIGHIALSR